MSLSPQLQEWQRLNAGLKQQVDGTFEKLSLHSPPQMKKIK